MSTNTDCLVVSCVCGGWVMVAALAYADAETFKNAGEMVGRGFAMRSPVPKAEFVAQPMCEHHGACTTDPKSIPDPNQQALAL